MIYCLLTLVRVGSGLINEDSWCRWLDYVFSWFQSDCIVCYSRRDYDIMNDIQYNSTSVWNGSEKQKTIDCDNCKYHKIVRNKI